MGTSGHASGRQRIRATTMIALLAGLSACGGGDDGAAPDATPPAAAAPTKEQLTATCSGLTGKAFAGVTVTSTQRFEASGTIAPSGFCKVNATRAPFLDIEVDVPDNWSGRLLHQGGAGFDGTIPTALTTTATGGLASLNSAISQRAAVYAASNGGNRANVPAQAAPAVWANGTSDGMASADDYAYVALGTTITFAKTVVQQFYAKAPSKTYFNGCSNGGRNAYIVAQRWPDQYDGIVSGCETMDMGGQTTAWMNLGSKAGTPAALTAAQYTDAFGAAVAACDGNDGLVDGIIANPSGCTFAPAALLCGASTANRNPALCLSAAQVGTLSGLLADLVLGSGTTAYSRFWWADFSAFGPSFGALGGGFALLATNDPAWLTLPKQQGFDLNRDYYVFGNGLLRRGADHDKAEIARFVASGKKLISWHDGADNLLSPNDHVRNYTTMINLARNMGLGDPRTNTRFFIVPGGSHSQGSSLTEVDWFAAIVDWVENGTAPTQLVYNRTVAGASRTLPVCEYPSYARYNGSGDVSAAASFTCTRPAT